MNKQGWTKTEMAKKMNTSRSSLDRLLDPQNASIILFIISIVIVVIFHFSPFHLIWLAVASFFLGIVSIMLPPVQGLSFIFLGLVKVFSQVDDDNEQQVKVSLDEKKKVVKNKLLKKTKGFGS